jgi:AcrR family transcriptional regulator
MVRARPAAPARARHRGAGGGARAAARVRILDAAEELFAEEGFDATPTARIAERAGVAKGLLFYYFPQKLDVLRTLFTERLPAHPLVAVGGIARRGDLAGSLLCLARTLDLGRHESRVLRTILFREAGTHPEAGQHLRTLHDGLLALTEEVLDAASPRQLDHRLRRRAADTYVAVMLYQANAQRVHGGLPDIEAAASIVSGALTAPAT